ncbi:hypothetical protein [Bradyrhizobium sp. USDA 3364]
MQSSTTFCHQDPKAAISNKIFRVALIGVTMIVAQVDPASAINIGASASLPIVKQQTQNSDVVEVRAVVRRGGVAVGPRGGAAAYRSRTVVRSARLARRRHALGRPSAGRLGAAWLVWMAGRRRDRGGRRGRLRDCGKRSRVGWRSAGAGYVLVLHRPVESTGFLGLLPTITRNRYGHVSRRDTHRWI